MREQTGESDKLKQMLEEERNKRLLIFNPLIEAERRRGSFSYRHAVSHCGMSSGEAETLVNQVCDNVVDAILNGRGPLSADSFRGYIKGSLNHEAARWREEQKRMVFLDADAAEIAVQTEPAGPADGPPADPTSSAILIEFLRVFVGRLLPPDGLHDAGSVRPVAPELHCVLGEYVAQQTRGDVLGPQERSLRRAVRLAIVQFGLPPQDGAALERQAYRRFHEAVREAFKSVPAARPLVKQLVVRGKMTPARLGELFGYVWQSDAEAEQGGFLRLPLPLPARRT